MDRIGILLYGYNMNDAAGLRSIIEKGLGRKIILFSASGREDKNLKEVLDAGNVSNFEECETKILIFLGFLDGDIQKTMQMINGKDIARPIFCTLTAENIHWTLKVLIEHLRKEDIYWKKKK
jgi:hypothetical protein